MIHCFRLLLASVAALSIASAANAETKLSDFAGVWESVGRGPPGGPGREGGGPPDRAASQDGSRTYSLGSPGPSSEARGAANRGGGARGPGAGIVVSEEDEARGLERGDVFVRSIMTEAGQARFAQLDLKEHPAYNCLSPGLPTIAGMPGLQDWSVDGSLISIRQEAFPEARTAALGAPNPAALAPHTRTGVATAKIEGDALVIRTTNLTEAWAGLSRNAPGSAERTVVETYRLVDANTIRGAIEITDPLYLTRPLRLPVNLRRAPTGTEFEVFPCDVEASQRVTGE
ncbi:hypothetical protein GC169_03035 [bacterium]|nr:hypothetical protein [bacterium]